MSAVVEVRSTLNRWFREFAADTRALRIGCVGDRNWAPGNSLCVL